MFHSEDTWYRPLNLPLSCEVVENVENMWFLGSRFLGQGILEILDMYFQIALTSEHVAGFG